MGGKNTASKKVKALGYKVKSSPYYVTMTQKHKNIKTPWQVLAYRGERLKKLKKKGNDNDVDVQYSY